MQENKELIIKTAAGGAVALILYLLGGAITVIAVLIVALLVYRYVVAANAQKEEYLRAAAYASAVAPFIVLSDNPEQSPADVQAKAAHIQAQLQASGNPYAGKLPVIVFPFSPYLGAASGAYVEFALYQQMSAKRIWEEHQSWQVVGKSVLASADYLKFMAAIAPPQTNTP